MPHSYGLNARTRDIFSRPFRRHGKPNVSTYLHQYKIGEFVDVMANSSVQNGMPHRIYHGKTGVVFNISPRAVGVEIIKRVGNRQVLKRIYVRIEHVRRSRCREDFVKRCKEHQKRVEETPKGQARPAPVKRMPAVPRGGELVRGEVIDMQPLAFAEKY